MKSNNLITESKWYYQPDDIDFMGQPSSLTTSFVHNGVKYWVSFAAVQRHLALIMRAQNRKKFEKEWVQSLTRSSRFPFIKIDDDFAQWQASNVKELLRPIIKFTGMPSNYLLNKQSKRRSNKKSLQELAKKLPPRDIKVGDYVEVQASKIDDLFNARQIRDIAKKTMNILYVYKLERGMLTVTPRRGISSPAVEVPEKYIRYKLTNVEQE